MNEVRVLDDHLLAAEWAMVRHEDRWLLLLRRSSDTATTRAAAWAWAAQEDAERARSDAA